MPPVFLVDYRPLLTEVICSKHRPSICPGRLEPGISCSISGNDDIRKFEEFRFHAGASTLFLNKGKSIIMPNAVPYLILIFLSVCTLIYVLFRTKQFVTFVWFLSFAGMIYIFEFVILVLFNSYAYYPKVFKDAYLDCLFGALISNFFAVPVVAITIVTFRLRFRWIIAFALFFTAIEWLFLHLGIYKHHWWRLPYTTFNLIFLFWLARYWANRTVLGSRLLIYLSLLMFTLSMCDTLSFLLVLVGFNNFHIGYFSNPTRDDILVRFMFILVTSLILATTIYLTTTIRWIVTALLATIGIQIILYAMGIIRIYISLWLFYLIFIVCHLLVVWLLIKSKHALRMSKSA